MSPLRKKVRRVSKQKTSNYRTQQGEEELNEGKRILPFPRQRTEKRASNGASSNTTN